MKFYYSLLISLCITTGLMAQLPGSLDSSFNQTGIVTLAPGTQHDVCHGLAVQPDEKIIFTGSARITATSGFTFDMVVGRMNADGTLDVTFGNNGYYNLGSTGGSVFGYDVRLQPDGKIVVCGGYSLTASNTEFLVVRLNPDGTPDTTFGGGDGISIITGNTSEDYAYAVRIRSDEKIVLAGTSKVPGFTYNKAAVLRLLPDGSPDTTFGTMGMTLIQPLSNVSYNFRAMDLDDGESIIAAGYLYQNNNDGFFMAGFTEDGLLKSTFANNGIYTGLSFSTAYDLVVDGGQLYSCGRTITSMGSDMAVARFDTLGVLDNTWGFTGLVLTDINAADVALALAIQYDGKVLLTGSSGPGGLGDRNFTTVRYTTSGLLDTGFGTSGIAIHPASTGFEDANAIALQADGKILTGGFAQFSNNDMVIMRLQNNIGGVGISEPLSSVSVTAFPVPLSGNLLTLHCGDLKNETNYKISITDVTGKMVSMQEVTCINGNLGLSLDEPLSNGIYHARILSNEVNVIAPFIIQRP
jgi:uncharacterized delta-60 repeat protein